MTLTLFIPGITMQFNSLQVFRRVGVTAVVETEFVQADTSQERHQRALRCPSG
jgi:hypothetical protein